jgi:hypothetical protein
LAAGCVGTVIVVIAMNDVAAEIVMAGMNVGTNF